MSIKISVVIPTYNRPALLLQCLDALTRQTFNKEEFEIIIVTDGPDNQTKKAVVGWNKWRLVNWRFFSLPFKKGPAAARNFGWLNARGELIAFTDDDCIPHKNWLLSYFNHYMKDQDVAFTGKTIVPISKRPTDYELNTANLQTAEFITANCCCPKNILVRTGGFDERFTMPWREDSDLEFKLINESIKIKRVEDAIVTHPVRKVIWGVSIKEQKKTMFNALLYKKYPELYRQKIQIRPPLNYYLIVLGFTLMITGVIENSFLIAFLGFNLWIVLTMLFIIKRLSFTSLSSKHIAEMVITSIIIPFLSLYWQIYGAIKYRVLFF